MVLTILLVFLIGLFVGSFLNVVIDRLPRNESFVKGRSYCESCKHTLSGWDLVPLFSFLYLRGKCRYCHTGLSLKYPLLEGITGLLYVLTYLSFYQNLYLVVFGIAVINALIIIFFIDLYKGIIPFVIILPMIILTAVYGLLFLSPSENIMHFASALVSFLLFFGLFVGTKGRGMGFGDVVYAFFLGLLLGFPNTILALYIAFLTGAFISLILILLRRKKLRGSTIPFGPFLVTGTFIAFLWGDLITNYILTTLL